MTMEERRVNLSENLSDFAVEIIFKELQNQKK
jgi:hypothetical protein